jgi:hypothetical protein
MRRKIIDTESGLAYHYWLKCEMLAVVEWVGQNGSEDHNYLTDFIVYINDGQTPRSVW